MIRTAKTENGMVRGIEAADPRITAFKGIPFAAPPVGKNRWRAPQPCENWEGVKECYRFAPISVQDTPGLGTDIYCREWHVDPEIAMGEDCLYLNVWTGAKSPEEKLPVVIWFFGGGFQWGYPAEMEFDGERVARRGVVVVTVNYRLNVFGFLAHPELTAEAPDAPTNFGLLDQQAGIKWVIRNIAAFGGDPEKITIAGQSAGAGSVMAQVTNPANKGLFQRAIVQSGLIRSPYEKGGFGSPEPMKDAEKNGKGFFDFLGVANLEEARKVDAFEILHKYGEYVNGLELFVKTDGGHRMFPVCDGKFCYGDSLELFMEGRHVPVTVMAGNTADEFLNQFSAKDEEDFERQVKEKLGEQAEEFLKFPESRRREADGAYARVSGIECAAKAMALNAQEREAGPVYYYRFDTDIPGWDNPGTFHSVELWFFFETLAKCWRPFVGRHYDLARQMCDYWTNFIKTGDPNGQGTDGTELPRWEPYSKEKEEGMAFTSQGAVPEQGDSDFKRFLIHRLLPKK